MDYTVINYYYDSSEIFCIDDESDELKKMINLN